MSQKVLSITQINEYIRGKMDADPLLSNLAVKGEISNYKVYPSGHHYFTLKDEGASLRCVMFRGNAMRLKFRPENGMQIIAMGKISVYPRDGAYQMYCTALTLDGVGDLYAAFEQLKAKLSAQGLFAQEHKKPLPQYPGRIGIVTSSAGAAVHDMLRILRKRFPLTKVLLLPVRVQGAEAPAEIVSAINYANYHRLADLLIVGRGGGSIEDLWAFNDERVAHAIYASQIPVISAVGHEPDFTIADFVADLRAATPSNAAELAVQDQDALRQTLDSMLESMISSVSKQINTSQKHLHNLASRPVLKSPEQYVLQRKKDLILLKNKIFNVQQQSISKKTQRFVSATAKLDALSPLKVLTRGYAMASDTNGNLIKSVKQVQQGSLVKMQFSDGSVCASVTNLEEK